MIKRVATPPADPCLAGMLVEGGLVLVALTLGWLLNQPLEIRFSLRECVWGLATTVPLLAMLLVTARWPVGPLKPIQEFLDDVALPAFNHCTLAELAILAGLAGLGEELMFRGILQGALARPLGLPAAIAVASLIFGMAHFVTATYAVLVTIVGVYLGVIFAVTDSLSTVILAHGLYDFIALVYLLRRFRRRNPLAGGRDSDRMG